MPMSLNDLFFSSSAQNNAGSGSGTRAKNTTDDTLKDISRSLRTMIDLQKKTLDSLDGDYRTTNVDSSRGSSSHHHRRHRHHRSDGAGYSGYHGNSTIGNINHHVVNHLTEEARGSAGHAITAALGTIHPTLGYAYGIGRQYVNMHQVRQSAVGLYRRFRYGSAQSNNSNSTASSVVSALTGGGSSRSGASELQSTLSYVRSTLSSIRLSKVSVED